MKNERGFSLLELCIVLIISSLLMTAFISIFEITQHNKANKETKKQLLAIQDSIRYFYHIHGRLPCPSTTNINDIDNIQFRELDCKKISTSPFGLNDGYAIHGNNLDTAVITGNVPVYDLNLHNKNSKDYWGHNIQYSVTLRLTNPFTHDQSKGAINIQNSSGKKINWQHGKAQYVLLSQGTNRCESKNGIGLEKNNCSDHQSFTYSNLSLAPGELSYDDLLVFEEYIRPPEQINKNTCSFVDHLSSYNLSLEEIKGFSDINQIPHMNSLVICNKKLLRKMDLNNGSCISIRCFDGNLVQDEAVIN